jgi:hypothetical protein
MNVSVKAFDGGSNENAAKTLLAAGQATGGPPCSDQVTFILPACSSQWISMRPPRMERAPYFAALVANSCSSSASSEMTFPEISTSLPVIEKRLDISCSWRPDRPHQRMQRRRLRSVRSGVTVRQDQRVRPGKRHEAGARDFNDTFRGRGGPAA